ncbi:MAG: XVIPCD domain-containing protein [Dyella sp.]|uniref:XVIPCD domain-containing protein n=1 Tax=Dyella sp. TaxID=1869338 RepID=UPI003F7F5DAD
MPLSAQAQAVIDAFGNQSGVTAEQLANLQATIVASPALTREVNDAVAQGHLQRIVPLTKPHAGGEYNPDAREMRLPLGMLSAPAGGHFDSGEPTFVLGHELQHGFNAAATAQAQANFTHELAVVAQSPGHDHDYTAPIGRLIAANRRDEAGAEISGWNAIVSAARQEAADHHRPAPTLADVYARNPGRMDDFIDVDRSHFPPTYVMKPNLTVNADLTMPATAHNIEGMGRNYFDRSGGLGHNGNSDYANYYGAYAVGVAATYERHYNPQSAGHAAPAHEMGLNLAQLHLDPRIMAENGIDLGPDTRPMPYADKSTQPPTQAHLDHTIHTHVYTPLAPIEPAVAPDLKDVAHPGHALYEQAHNAVLALDARHGREPDQRSDNLAAALCVAACRDGMSAIHHVELSEDASRAFAVQGDVRSPLKRIAQVDTGEAVRTTVAQSSRTWEQLGLEHSTAALQIAQPTIEPVQQAPLRLPG